MQSSKRKIILRADGSHKIGMGHVTRLISIGNMLKDTFNLNFATRNTETSILKSISECCDKLISLPSNDDHYHVFLDLLAGDEIVILDNYLFTSDYQKAIRDKGCQLVCIDDMHDKDYYADVVINQTPGLRKEQFSIKTYTKLALGPDYAMLREPFLSKAAGKRTSGPGDSIFVCYGGADPLNLTLKTLRFLDGLRITTKIIAVTGGKFQFSELVEDYVKDKPNIQLYSDIGPETIVELLERCKLAIVPSSSILFEVLCFNITVITGYYTDNQVDTYKGFLKYKFVHGADDLRLLSSDSLGLLLEQVTQNVVDGHQNIIDGRSGIRIRELINNLS